ncbi:MAG: mechanosensitive ion channel domain-containing protein [Pseudomonadota bacterium]
MDRVCLRCVSAWPRGSLYAIFWRNRASRRQIEIAEPNIAKGSYGTLRTILDAAFFLVIELSSSVAFALTAMATLYFFFQHPDLRYFASSYIAMVTVVLVVRSVVDFMFPRGWPIYRLVALSEEATRLVHWVVIGLASLWMFETTTSGVMASFGAPEGAPDLFSLLLGVFWITSVLTGIALINRATVDLAPPETDRSLSSVLTRNWAAIMMVSQVLTWMLFTGGALVSGNVDVVAAGIFSCMMIFIGFWMGCRILIHYLRAQALNDVIKAAIARAVRSLLLAVGVLMVLAVWGIDSKALATAAVTGDAIQTIVNAALTVLVCWAVWDFLRTIVDLRVEAEKPSDAAEEMEGEGGLGASRSATLPPLLRSTALVIIAMVRLFTALSSLGVYVAPLIAGAGVVGLAIEFGAQTLVKDIVSGVFFLIDDAFRRGEYIDLGSVKGTVERISVRSLQLRHHLGAVHAIPFGDIAALTNYSRDWVIMKLPLRLTFDTDPKKVKKIIKRIGAELMEDELVGDGLLEPPKSQGVIQMEDSAMILRVKFKAIPGKQFPIRRDLLHRIRAAFREADIRFANREVTVRVQENATDVEKQQAIAAAASRAVEGPQPAT